MREPRDVHLKKQSLRQVKWLTPVILATQEMDIRKIKVQGETRQKFMETSQPIKNGTVTFPGKCK
jgi:hypothetical protein